MRNVILALFALVLSAPAAPAQSLDWANKMFRQTSHDFGNVPRGAELQHQFQMTNIWAVPIEVMSVRTSCGCVTVTPSTQVLKPRASGILDVKIDARKFVGPKTVSIYVLVGPEYTSTATIQVSANSRADVVFNPGQVNFDVVPAGQAPVKNIDVEYAGNLDWRVTEVIKNSAPLDVTLEEFNRQQGQVGYHVRVALKPDAPAGSHKWELLLKTNDPSSPLVPVLVEATVQATLTVNPGTLSLGTLKLGETISKRVVVRGSRPFKIVAIEGLGEGIEADLVNSAAAVQILTVKYQPIQAGELKRQLVIKTDMGGEAPVIVTVEGSVVP